MLQLTLEFLKNLIKYNKKKLKKDITIIIFNIKLLIFKWLNQNIKKSDFKKKIDNIKNKKFTKNQFIKKLQ